MKQERQCLDKPVDFSDSLRAPSFVPRSAPAPKHSPPAQRTAHPGPSDTKYDGVSKGSGDAKSMAATHTISNATVEISPRDSVKQAPMETSAAALSGKPESSRTSSSQKARRKGGRDTTEPELQTASTKPELQTASNKPNPLATKVCGMCGHRRHKNDFSKTQVYSVCTTVRSRACMFEFCHEMVHSRA